MKQLKLFWLAAGLLLSVCAGFAQSGTMGSLEWSLSEGTLTISGSGDMPDYLSNTVPWHSYRTSITTVVIEENVKSIGNYAFYECVNLTLVTIPNTVKSIGSCTFFHCSNLSSITISENVTSIGYAAFSDCSNLISISIPKNVTSIEKYVFYGCSRLSAINVEAANENYSSDNGILYDKHKTALILCPEGKTGAITIPNCVILIGNNAFECCLCITSITISESVTSIGNSAFYSCSSLTSVTIGNNVASIEEGAFGRCSALTSVTIANSVQSIKNFAFQYCSSLTSVTIGNSVTSIGTYVFFGCSSLTSITIPESVTSIGYSAFTNCASLHTINFNAINCTSMSAYSVSVFDGCATLNTLNIGALVTRIPDYAFRNCSSLQTVNYNPVNCMSVGSSAFYGCSAFTTLNIGNQVQNIPNSTFANCTGLETVNFNAINCTTMGNSSNPVFQNCSSLTNLNIGNGVTRIPDYAFSGCSGITSLVIPNSITDIASNAFTGCNIEELTISRIFSQLITAKLKKLSIGAECTSIPSNSFSTCSNLEELSLPFIGTTPTASTALSALFGGNVPATLKKLALVRSSNNIQIANNALSGLSQLTELTLSSNVRGLGENALYGCNQLEHIYSHWAYPPTAYNSSTFSGVNKYMCMIHVPVGSKQYYSLADGWKEFFSPIDRIEEEAAVTLVARAVPLYGGEIGGLLQYNYDATAKLTATGNSGYDFQGWMENESIVSANREYSFTVECPRTLYAVFTPRENENNVEVETQPTEAVISWDGEMGASSYTLIVYSDAARTQEYARFAFNADGTLRANESRLSYTLNNLTAGQRYYYTVTSYDNENYKLAIAIGNFITDNVGIVVETRHTTSLPIGYYNMMGQKLSKEPERGAYIILYDNGKAVKVMR